MNGDGSLRVELHHDAPGGEHTVSWDLETLTDGPNGTFIAIDEDDTPRLILEPETLMELQQRADERVLNG